MDKFIEYLKGSGKSENTQIAYNLCVNKFFEKNSQWNPKIFPEFLSQLGKNSTRRLYYYALKSYCEFEELEFSKMKIPKVSSVERATITEAQIEAAWACGASGETMLRRKSLFCLMAGSGLRVSEAIGVKLSDIDFKDRMLRVHGKGDKIRIVFFSESQGSIWNSYLESKRTQSDYLISLRGGQPVKRNSAYADTIKYLSACGIKAHPHSLRHAFATQSHRNGADIRYIQKILGHENISTTQIYVNPDESYMRKMFESTGPLSGTRGENVNTRQGKEIQR